MKETDVQTTNNSGSREGNNISTESEMKDDTAHQSAKWKSDKKNKSARAKENNHYIRFRPFFKAIQEKDWKGVVDFVERENKADPAFITSKFVFSYFYETVFHILSRNLNVPIWVFEKFASMFEPGPPLFMDDQHGQSPLFSAALSGNIEAAKFFVSKDKDLPNRRSNGNDLLPIQTAAKWGHKEIVQFLWEHTAQESLNHDEIKLKNKRVFDMLEDLINSGHYDVAFELLKKYPNLAREKKERGSILEMLAGRPSAFKNRCPLGYWERKIYEWILVPEDNIVPHKSADEENQNPISKSFSKKCALFQKLRIMLWKPLNQVQCIKSLYEKKLTHMHTLEIVKTMCHYDNIGSYEEGCYDVIWGYEEALESLWKPLNSAIRLGICELVIEILKTNYYSYALCNKDKNEDILHLAILHRQEKVFQHIREMKIFHWEWKVAPERAERKEIRETGQHVDADAAKRIISDQHSDVDAAKEESDQHSGTNAAKGKKGKKGQRKRTENLLHLAAKYVPSNQASGPALQMQRELQWFKAVEAFVHPAFQEQRNNKNKTPREVFTEQHEKLVEEGQQWMKDTATSCTVVAALIITVVFAAAFTVPGGNNTDGYPLFLHQPSFIVFIISDALAFFSSTASVFMFLGILTSRYSEEDFLTSLPRKLIIGLITMFFSIASMMTAFNAAIYILLSDLRLAVFIPIALLGGLTVLLFAKLQFPLLYEMYKSTYKSILYPPPRD